MAKQFIGSKVPNVEITELAIAPVDDFAMRNKQISAFFLLFAFCSAGATWRSLIGRKLTDSSRGASWLEVGCTRGERRGLAAARGPRVEEK
uniref:Uncharacterized protein n=1 Tax=Cannabis sativa TaxID=3483 RepID=A0A803NKB1_CANSA